MSHRKSKVMSRTEILKRNIVFLIAVFLGGFGVATVTYAHLGTTPISSANYVFSLHTPLSLGGTTFVFNMILIVLQLFLFGKEYVKKHALIISLQIPVTFIFAAAIDGGMYLLLQVFTDDPEALLYGYKLVFMAAGSLIIALGVSLQVCADVAMVSGEAFVKALAMRLEKDFGTIKLFFDCTLVTIAIVSSLIFTGFTGVEGVREGTLFGALAIGPTVKILLPRLKKFTEPWFTKDRVPQPQAQETLQEETASKA